MSIIKITKENFDSEVIDSDKPVLLDFSATWCGPCRMLAPIIDEIADEREDIKVGKIDVDTDGELASRYGVFNIPNVIVIKNGQMTAQSVGYRPKADIVALLDK